MLSKNDILKLNILSISSEGSGVSKTSEGVTVFVPNSAVGDELLVRIVKVQKTYAFGKVEEIITPSTDRITPTCTVGTQCGGCVYCHISYSAELKAKEQRVKDAIERIAKLSVPINPILSTNTLSRYRNKAMIPIGLDKNGEVIMGFYSKHSHRIIENDDCTLQPNCFLKASQILKSFIESHNLTVYSEASGKGLFRHLYLRLAEKTDQLMITLVINGKELPFEAELIDAFKNALPNLKSVILNTNCEDTNVVLGKHSRTLFGEGFITDILCSLKFMISPQSFYQVNRNGAELLYSKASEYADLSGNEVLLDLYCGTGTIGLSMANKAKSLIGVEIVPKAIEDAKKNAKANSIENARFICGDAAKAAETLRSEGLTPDVIIIDPPRKGCDKSLIKTISDFNPKRVVYVSCDPATLARDLAVFAELGFKAQEITPVDMFPRTAHVEAVALLSRQIDIHKMQLNSAPFEMIKSGEKTIELRLYDEKRQKIKIGDQILFTDNITGETLNKTVKKLHQFDTFDELYKSLPLLQCGYTSENIDKATPYDMEQYYSVEEQNKYGVVGIELCDPNKPQTKA